MAETLKPNPSGNYTEAVGLKLSNNDPRCPPARKIVTVIDADTDHVFYKAGTRTAKIAYHRIFTDGQDRHQGYNVVTLGQVS